LILSHTELPFLFPFISYKSIYYSLKEERTNFTKLSSLSEKTHNWYEGLSQAYRKRENISTWMLKSRRQIHINSITRVSYCIADG
jgi:hypothetical protein